MKNRRLISRTVTVLKTLIDYNDRLYAIGDDDGNNYYLSKNDITDKSDSEIIDAIECRAIRIYRFYSRKNFLDLCTCFSEGVEFFDVINRAAINPIPTVASLKNGKLLYFKNDDHTFYEVDKLHPISMPIYLELWQSYFKLEEAREILLKNKLVSGVKIIETSYYNTEICGERTLTCSIFFPQKKFLELRKRDWNLKSLLQDNYKNILKLKTAKKVPE